MEQRLEATYLRPGLFERAAALGIGAVAIGTGILLAAWGISLLWRYTPPEIAVRIANPEVRVTQSEPFTVTQDKPFKVAQSEPCFDEEGDSLGSYQTRRDAANQIKRAALDRITGDIDAELWGRGRYHSLSLKQPKGERRRIIDEVAGWAAEKPREWLVSARRVTDCWKYFRRCERLGLFPGDEVWPDLNH